MSTSTLVMSKPVTVRGGDLQKATYAFLEKLTMDDSTKGLHIEPIANSVDRRVRTGRISQQYRAVLFRLDGSANPVYVFVGVWNHDEAIARAKTATLTLNPVNGITEVRMTEVTQPPAPALPDSAPAETLTTEEPATPMLPYRADELTTGLGLDADLVARALAVTEEEGLLDLAVGAVEWQGLALIDLAAGVQLDVIRDKLGIAARTVPADSLSEDDRLTAGLRHPAAGITFTFIDDDEELRRVIESGTVDAWRVFLHPEQRTYADRATTGSFRLSGGAGTGKTVVLVHRARRLARADPTARVFLTTYTTNLASELRRSLLRLDPALPVTAAPSDSGVSVLGLDALASAVLRDTVGIAIDQERVLGATWSAVSGRTDAPAAWRAAIDQAGQDLPAPLQSPAFFEAEYALVVLPQRIVDRDHYLRVRRPGRGTRLTRRDRIAVWSVVESYRLAARAVGTIDFAEAAALAAAHLDRIAAGGGGRRFDHVLVDEGQDLGPTQWQLIRALVTEGPDDVFIAEDSHQRIYGHRLTLSQLGVRITGRSRRLTLNYRTTAENLAYAVQLLEGGTYDDLEELPEQSGEYRSARSGPRPELLPCSSLANELDTAAELVTRWIADSDERGVPRNTIAILVRDRYQRDRVVSGLAERAVQVRGVEREAAGASDPVVMTMHRAKGTEFYRVLLFDISRSSVPRSVLSHALPAEDRADALLRERSLLYVAATRARDELAISWSKEASVLLPGPRP